MHVSAPVSSVQTGETQKQQLSAGRGGRRESAASPPPWGPRDPGVPRVKPSQQEGALLGTQEKLNKCQLHKGCQATKQRLGR